MGETTGIEWTDHTFNPWIGCTKVSPGCTKCYAETFSKRFFGPLWGPGAPRHEVREDAWRKLSRWERLAEKAGERRRVFTASLSDVFDTAPARNILANDVMARGRERLWKAVAKHQGLDFLLLTKRPENVRKLAPWGESWPANVWLGTTVEDQKRAEERIPVLLDIPAKVRFLSCEPLLEDVELDAWLGEEGYESGGPAGWVQTREHGIDWVIVGGESGSTARLFNPTWAKNILNACARYGVACFMKQLGENRIDLAGAIKSKKGDDPSEWPEWMRVRQFPSSVVA